MWLSGASVKSFLRFLVVTESKDTRTICDNDKNSGALAECAGEGIQDAPGGQHNEQDRQREGKPDVLGDDAPRRIGQPDKAGETAQICPQERCIGSSQGDLVEFGANGNSDVSAAESRRIVYSIADHHDGASRGLLGAHDLELLGGKNFGDDLIHPKGFADFVRDGRSISRKKDEPADSKRPHRGQRVMRFSSRLVA